MAKFQKKNAKYEICEAHIFRFSLLTACHIYEKTFDRKKVVLEGYTKYSQFPWKQYIVYLLVF